MESDNGQANLAGEATEPGRVRVRVDRPAQFVRHDVVAFARHLTQPQALLLLQSPKDPQRSENACWKRDRADASRTLGNFKHSTH
jgi:hypothetical protein